MRRVTGAPTVLRSTGPDVHVPLQRRQICNLLNVHTSTAAEGVPNDLCVQRVGAPRRPHGSEQLRPPAPVEGSGVVRYLLRRRRALHEGLDRTSGDGCTDAKGRRRRDRRGTALHHGLEDAVLAECERRPPVRPGGVCHEALGTRIHHHAERRRQRHGCAHGHTVVLGVDASQAGTQHERGLGCAHEGLDAVHGDDLPRRPLRLVRDAARRHNVAVLRVVYHATEHVRRGDGASSGHEHSVARHPSDDAYDGVSQGHLLWHHREFPYFWSVRRSCSAAVDSYDARRKTRARTLPGLGGVVAVGVWHQKGYEHNEYVAEAFGVSVREAHKVVTALQRRWCSEVLVVLRGRGSKRLLLLFVVHTTTSTTTTVVIIIIVVILVVVFILLLLLESLCVSYYCISIGVTTVVGGFCQLSVRRRIR
eukprot:PhM_4_TR14961/c0_g1_i1/m.68587